MFGVLWGAISWILFLVILAILATKVYKVYYVENNANVTVGFFHPYCNAGGGGERVLWCAIRSLQKKYPNIECYVYTGDVDASPQEILSKAEKRFNVKLSNVKFVYLRSRFLIEAKTYPHFTLLGQMLGSFLVGLEAFHYFVPDVFIDTMGYVAVYPIFRFIGRSQIHCYVHYPTISTDMINVVGDSTNTYNNKDMIATSKSLTKVKLLYYKLFAKAYSMLGNCADVVMVNSTWTKNHILELWKMPEETHLVYPPCDVQQFSSLPIVITSGPINIVSIGQFRPEKDHDLQLRAFKYLLTIVDPKTANRLKLVLIGGCRDKMDELRVEKLKNLASELHIGDKVCFELNISFESLKKHMEIGTIGIHTMWNEHFGIGIVESMAGGLLMVAHNSGGPKLDIVKLYNGQKTGYLASSEEEYATCIKEAIYLEDYKKQNMIKYARLSMERFSEEKFEQSFLDATEDIDTQLFL